MALQLKMPNFTSNLRDSSLTPYTSSANAITANGFERINTGVVDQDGTGDPIRTAMHKILANLDKTISAEDLAIPATAGKIVQRDSNGDIWARKFYGDVEGTVTDFSGTLQGDITGTMKVTRINNTTNPGNYTLLTINNRGLVTSGSRPTDVRQLGVTNAVTSDFNIVTTNPLTGGGTLTGGSLTLGIDPSFLSGVAIPATANLVPGDGIRLSPQDAGGTFRLIDNLTVSVRLTESSHGALGSFVGGNVNQPSHALATTTAPGFMSPQDKVKLDQVTTAPVITRGMILMWNRPISQLPSGYVVCNGQNGTPNLIRRYPRGAGADSELNTFIGSATHAHAVDTPGAVLTTAQLPSFFLTGNTTAEGGHFHSGQTSISGRHAHPFTLTLYTQRTSGTAGSNRVIEMAVAPRQLSNFDEPQATEATGDHNHAFNTSVDGWHQHNFTTNWIGSNQPHTHPRVTSLEATHLPESTYVYFVMKL